MQDLRSGVGADLAGTGAQGYVTGETAANLDVGDMTATTCRRARVVLGLSFLLLLVAFRSVVSRSRSASTCSRVGAAYGLLVLVTQEGVGADLLGFQTSDTIESWLPLFLFTCCSGSPWTTTSSC